MTTPIKHKPHEYSTSLVWTGAAQGMASYQTYSREHEVRLGDKPPIRMSADPAFRGDAALLNPEDLLVASLSSCHLLSYLADCMRAGVVIVGYEDNAHGVMEYENGTYRFTEVVLHPRVTVSKEADVEQARALHERAHRECFIAQSVNFPVRHEVEVIVRE